MTCACISDVNTWNSCLWNADWSECSVFTESYESYLSSSDNGLKNSGLNGTRTQTSAIVKLVEHCTCAQRSGFEFCSGLTFSGPSSSGHYLSCSYKCEDHTLNIRRALKFGSQIAWEKLKYLQTRNHSKGEDSSSPWNLVNYRNKPLSSLHIIQFELLLLHLCCTQISPFFSAYPFFFRIITEAWEEGIVSCLY